MGDEKNTSAILADRAPARMQGSLIFYKILYNAFYQTVPLMKQKIRHKKPYQTPWITKEILAVRKFKNKLYERFINNPNDTNDNNYKTCRNKFNKMNRIAKKIVLQG